MQMIWKSIFTNGNATPSNHVINLPATAAGIIYTFVFVGTAGEGFQISPNSSDKMGSIVDVNGNIVTAANDGLGTVDKDLILDAGSKVGDRVTLIGDGDNGWVISDGVGKNFQHIIIS